MKTFLSILLFTLFLSACSTYKGLVPEMEYRVYDITPSKGKYTFAYDVEVYLSVNPDANVIHFLTNDSTYQIGQELIFGVK
jgi:hypothetical protein